MANKLYTKDEMNFEGISMQEGKSSSTLKLLAFMIVTAVILGLLIFTAGSFLAGESDENKDTPQITILPTSSRAGDPTDSPTPTEAVDITQTVTPKVTSKLTPTVASTTKKSVLTIEILNGSGVKGAAGKMSTELVNAGYSVSRTGNADAFDYTGVTVNIKKSKASLLDQLKKDLSASDYIVTESKSVLAETSTVDAVIILGVVE